MDDDSEVAGEDERNEEWANIVLSTTRENNAVEMMVGEVVVGNTKDQVEQ